MKDDFKRQHLDDEKFYMNPFTENVDTGENWLADFRARKDKSEDWEAWGGNELVAVVNILAGKGSGYITCWKEVE